MSAEQCAARDYSDYLERCQLVEGHECPHAVRVSVQPIGPHWWLPAGGFNRPDPPMTIPGIPDVWPWFE